MCGIAGVIGKAAREEITASMLNCIQHRGPDGRRIWGTAGLSFGHLRLSIIDVNERASQPMVCAGTGNVIIFNGEIYNYIELKEELEKHYDFHTESDTEVILAAYAFWGISFIGKLRGMFAFALYDAAEKKVLVARDRLGIKPLYYSQVNGSVFFSSEIKALVASGEIDYKPNVSKILAFQSFRHLDTDDQTCFTNIFQLPAASYMYIGMNGHTSAPVSYWALPETCSTRLFDERAAEEFYEKLKETISIHLRSDVKVGAFVSGGLDSSAIACLASSLLGKEYKLELFSYKLKHGLTEENELIPSVQNWIEGVSNELYNSGENFLDRVAEVIYHHDEPLPDASMFIHYELCRLASERKIKVLLSGSGGDELLGGYQSHTYAQFGSLLKKMRLKAYYRKLKNFNTSKYESKAHIVARSIQEASPFSLRNIQKQAVVKKQQGYWNSKVDASAVRFYYSENKDPWIANYLNYYKSWTTPPYLHYEDRNSMAFGVEIRVPFFDHQLIEYIMQFDPDTIVSDISKKPLRMAMKNAMPPEVLNEKSKHGFPAPLDLYFRYDTKKTIEYFLENVKATPFFSFDKAEVLCNKYFSGDQKLHNDFWRIMSISIWYNKFFNKW